MTGNVRIERTTGRCSGERLADAERVAAETLASAWLAEAAGAGAGIPAQRSTATDDGSAAGMFAAGPAEPAYLAAMRERLPGVPDDALHAAASCWALVGSVRDAQAWWDAGVSPLDQRALEYRAAGLTPDDLARHLGPYTVLQHLRKGSTPAWCVARLARQRRDGTA
jgi:uncharacterized protein (DUF433 family)